MDLKNRIQKHKAIEAHRNKPLIVYATSTREGVGAMMASDAVREFIDQVDGIKEGKGVDVLLHSSGGDALAAWKLMSILRERFNQVSVLVPFMAFSAASFFAHGDAVSRSRARELDLQVAKDDKDLERLIWEAYLGLESYMTLRRPFNPLQTFLDKPQGAAALTPSRSPDAAAKRSAAADRRSLESGSTAGFSPTRSSKCAGRIFADQRCYRKPAGRLGSLHDW